MSKLNKKITHSPSPAPYGLAVSGNGNVQFKKSPEQILFEVIVSTLYGKDSFYESANDKVVRMRAVLRQVVEENGLKGAEYAGRVAMFAREHMYIRTMPIVMVVELAKILQERSQVLAGFTKELENAIASGSPTKLDIGKLAMLYDGTKKAGPTIKELDLDELRDLKISLNMNPPIYSIRNLVKGVVSRADELTDMFAYALSVFGDPTKKSDPIFKASSKVPFNLRRGLADSFSKFDAYQFGKYNREGAVSFKDLLRIVHPHSETEETAEIFKKIMAESLETPHTWETVLSANGQLPVDERKSNAQLWTELVTHEGSGSLGYMALLRNLRNMQEAGLDEATWKLVAGKISNPKAVAKSKQLPFGFINAHDVAKEAGVPTLVINALRDATEQALANMPKLGDRVWIIVDSSGSMGYSPSAYGTFGARPTENSPIKIAAIFGAALAKAAKNSFQFAFTMFDDNARNVDLNTSDSIYTMYEKIMSRNAGGGTNLESAFRLKSKLGFEPDTVIVLSDMEINSLTTGTSIDKLFKPDCIKVAVNLASRDSTPLAGWNGWIQLSGFSPRIFQFVKFTREAEGIVQQLFDGGKVPLAGEPLEVEEA